ncbi:MAG: hypothetical protein KKE05_04700, partial [Nanoarchaeota archaeon]|nr:hypothetical protein [Nanoarchaeota archaeon]
MSKGKENWWEKKEATNFEMFVMTFGAFFLLFVGIILGLSIISLQTNLAECRDEKSDIELKASGVSVDFVWKGTIFGTEYFNDCHKTATNKLNCDSEFGLIELIHRLEGYYEKRAEQFQEWPKTEQQPVRECVCSFGENCEGCKIINGREYCYQEICDYAKCQDSNRRICNVNGNTSLCTPDWCDENLGKCEPLLYPEGQ